MSLEIDGNDRAFLRQASRPAEGGRGCIRLVDLFAGCGGMTLGAVEAARSLGRRCDVRLAVERSEFIAATYARNFDPAYGSDASSVEKWFDGAPNERLSLEERRTKRLLGDVDLLVGGPPCQGHSNLNNHTRGRDPKNSLYLKMVRAAEVVEPSAIVVENVPGLERDSGHVLDLATRHLQRLGYRIDLGVVGIDEVGVAQLRRRHVLVAHRENRPDLRSAVSLARPTRPRTLRWAIGDLMKREGKSSLDAPSVLSAENRARARYLLENDLYDLPNARRPPCHRSPHRYKSMYGRLRWSEPAQTITTGFGSPGQGRYLHPERLRTLTAHEAARIQFFPDWFDFSPIPHRTALAEAIGNAVPPKLVFVLARHLLALGMSANREVSATG